jgi:hypothetical protein
LPFGGLLGLFFPLILIVALIYFLVNRQKVAPGPPGLPPSPNPAGAFCRHCGKPIASGAHFCDGCGGRQVD